MRVYCELLLLCNHYQRSVASLNYSTMAIVNETSSDTNNMLLYVSIIGFAIISYVLYKFVLSPSQPANTQQRQQQQQRTAASSTRTIRPSTSTTSSTTAAKNNTDNDDYKFGQSRHPSHLLPPSNWSNNKEDLSGYLLKGIIPFRSTYANGFEVRLQQQQQKMKNEQTDGKDDEVKDLVVVNRKERARIFARMFSSSTSATTAKSTSTPSKPPNRGSNIVITIHHTDVITTTTASNNNNNCVDSKLHKILYLLGTYYNVFVLVDASDVVPQITNDVQVKEYIDKVRTKLYTASNSDNEYQLNEQIIPTHRIIVSTTSSGRVAFVRQLSDTQLVIDYDVDGVVKELERFGFRTLCYPRVDVGEGESSLGKFLIP